MAKTRHIVVTLNPTDLFRPIRIQPSPEPSGEHTTLDGEKLYVRSGDSEADADNIVFEAKKPAVDGKPIEFSLFFPNGEVIHDTKSEPNALRPLNGGDAFNSNGTPMTLRVNARLEKKRTYEYYITATDPDTGLVYTDDPDVYVDC